MGPLLRIAGRDQLPPPGELREFALEGGRTICVANDGGRYSAVAGLCPHVGAPLAQGDIEDGKVVCPWHGWEFQLSDGVCANRRGASVQHFQLVIDGEDVFLHS
jgi:nitrite reductase/ring-hydroxylating ferredoxin subunit